MYYRAAEGPHAPVRPDKSPPLHIFLWKILLEGRCCDEEVEMQQKNARLREGNGELEAPGSLFSSGFLRIFNKGQLVPRTCDQPLLESRLRRS